MGKKRKGRSTQELMGIQNFTRYGLATNRGELLFFLVSPTNISVLSHTNIEIKIRHLMMVLSAIPDIEIFGSLLIPSILSPPFVPQAARESTISAVSSSARILPAVFVLFIFIRFIPPCYCSTLRTTCLCGPHSLKAGLPGSGICSVPA